MECDLKKMFEYYRKNLPPVDSEEPFITTDGSLPIPKDTYNTSSLIIKRKEHVYGSFKVDDLWFIAKKSCYRHLGLLILSCIFSTKEQITINLRHPNSDVKRLKIISLNLDEENLTPGFHEKPFAHSYWAAEVDTHPWIYSGLSRLDLPSLSLTNDDDFLLSQEHWNNRDVINGFGNNRASTLLAELFLNIGRGERKNRTRR